MSKKLIGQDPAKNHHSEDIFGSLLQEYEVHLQARGYQARTVQAYLESALHFT